MILATSSVTLHPIVRHGLQYYAFTILILALALLLLLKLVYWALNVWEKWRIIAHYRREEKAKRSAQSPITRHLKK
jgi:hypothetical protein